MKIERDTNYDETTYALTDAISEAMQSADWSGLEDGTKAGLTCCDDERGSAVIIRTAGRRFELRLVEVL